VPKDSVGVRYGKVAPWQAIDSFINSTAAENFFSSIILKLAPLAASAGILDISLVSLRI
jgi:hypothetical protein